MSNKAMKLALEYLKLQKKYGPAMAYGNTTIDEAIDAIKTVLVADFVSDFVEQPAQQEPVAYDKTELNCFAQDLYNKKMREGKHGHYESMFHVIHMCIKKVASSPAQSN